MINNSIEKWMENMDKQFTEDMHIPNKHMKYEEIYPTASLLTRICKLK
jgi:hypothetical protein